MGAYSELDLDRKYEDDPFIEDDPFDEDDDTCVMMSASDGGCTPRGEPEPAPVTPPQQPQSNTLETQPVEAPSAAPAQPADNADKAAADEDAKRKAEFDARQKQKRDAEKLALAKLEAMSDDEVLAASVKRVGDDTEKLTRRNMKECIMEHIQTLCLDNPDFARKVLHPRKSMIHCIWYINRKAKEFIEQEMKNNDIKPENGIYGGDVPDDLCYQWAVDYFNDPNAKEDEEKEEKFVAQPYRGTGTSASKKSASSKGKSKGKDAKKKDEDTAKPKAKEKAKGDPEDQMSLLGVA